MESIALNRKASFDYNFKDKIEAGLVLTGSEVKSLRKKNISIKESYIGEKKSELWLFNCHINNYQQSLKTNQVSPTRVRKILLSKKEKDRVIGLQNKEGYSIVPISIYFNKRGFAKVLIGVGKGKKKYDKRQQIKKKDWNIQKQRILKNKSNR